MIAAESGVSKTSIYKHFRSKEDLIIAVLRLRDENFRNWLYRIASNVALDALRRRRETVDVDGLQLANPSSGPEERTESMERDDMVRRAVLALPPASRMVLVLREYEQLSYKEIAKALAIPVGTVMSRLNYARSSLRKALAPYLEQQL